MLITQINLHKAPHKALHEALHEALRTEALHESLREALRTEALHETLHRVPAIFPIQLCLRLASTKFAAHI